MLESGDPQESPLMEESGPSGESVALAMAAAAAAFFLVYATTVLIEVLPAQPGDPVWVQRLVGAVLTNIGFPLIGLILMLLAQLLWPTQPQLARWTRRVQQLAVVAAVLLLLLIPAHGLATLRLLQVQAADQAKELRQAEQRYATLRRLVLEASSPEQLQEQFQRNEGPQLMRADLARPMPVLRQDLLQGLAEARKQAVQQLSGPSASAVWTAGVRSLQMGSIALAMAMAFAAGALLPGSDTPLLVQWADTLSAGRRRRAARRSAAAIAWMESEREREELARAERFQRGREEDRLREMRRRERSDNRPGQPDDQDPELQRRLNREGRKLWTLNQEFDDYYQEIAPEDDDPSAAPEPRR